MGPFGGLRREREVEREVERERERERESAFPAREAVTSFTFAAPGHTHNLNTQSHVACMGKL